MGGTWRIGGCAMSLNKADSTEWRAESEQIATEELLEWAHEMDFFGGAPFVWDTRHGLNLKAKPLSKIDLSRKGPDELLSNLSRNDRPPLPGDRRGSCRRAQDC